MQDTKRILIIDDDAEASQGLARLLTANGYQVQEENDSSKARATAKAFEPQVVILDFLMPKVHGGDVAWQLASDPLLRNIRLIICSGLAEHLDIASQLPPAKIPILEKPVDTDALLKLIAGNSE